MENKLWFIFPINLFYCVGFFPYYPNLVSSNNTINTVLSHETKGVTYHG